MNTVCVLFLGGKLAMPGRLQPAAPSTIPTVWNPLFYIKPHPTLMSSCPSLQWVQLLLTTGSPHWGLVIMTRSCLYEEMVMDKSNLVLACEVSTAIVRQWEDSFPAFPPLSWRSLSLGWGTELFLWAQTLHSYYLLHFDHLHLQSWCTSAVWATSFIFWSNFFSTFCVYNIELNCN